MWSNQLLVHEFLRQYTHRMFGNSVALYTCSQHPNGNIEICYRFCINERGDTVLQRCLFLNEIVWLMFCPMAYAITAKIIQDTVAIELQQKWYNIL